MFFWKTPAFGTTPEFAEKSAPLAANQGLYNGFLAAALIWGLIATDPTAFQFTLYGLACVIVDGLYGAATANKRILFVQVSRGPLALIGGHRAARTAILTVSRTRAEELTRTRVGTRGPAGRGPRAVPSGAFAYGRWRVRSLRRADWREGVATFTSSRS
jgi:putative membrane protein